MTLDSDAKRLDRRKGGLIAMVNRTIISQNLNSKKTRCFSKKKLLELKHRLYFYSLTDNLILA